MKHLKLVSQDKSILYVEDNEDLRESTVEFFESIFENVITAKDGREAIELYKSSTKPFDIVITDIQMPHMDGIELSREIIKQNRSQKIIVVSAYNETKYFIELIKIGISGFMQKPLTSVQIIEILYDVCIELDEMKENENYIKISESLSWNKELKTLLHDNNNIDLTTTQTDTMDMFLSNLGRKFTDIDIYNHIYYKNVEKEFSSDAIKSLIKRLRKKIPQELIKNNKKLGYYIEIL